MSQKLSILAAERPNRCSTIDHLKFRCRFELRKGLFRTRVLEVTVEYPPTEPDMVGVVSVRNFTELFGSAFRLGG